MTKKELPDDLTPSICAAALERFSQSEDSLAGIIEQHHIAVREFMIVSLICDQEELGLDQLSRALGLSAKTVIDCVERMIDAGMLQLGAGSSLHLEDCRIQSTPAGQLITRKILGNVG